MGVLCMCTLIIVCLYDMNFIRKDYLVSPRQARELQKDKVQSRFNTRSASELVRLAINKLLKIK